MRLLREVISDLRPDTGINWPVIQRASCEAINATTGATGCFLVEGALACSAAAQSVQQALAKQRAQGELELRQRFDRAVAEGDLPRDVDAADLARFVSTVSHGLAVQAAGGAAVAALALQSVPSSDNPLILRGVGTTSGQCSPEVGLP